MTSVLSGAFLERDSEASAGDPWPTPQPAKANQFKTAPGSHPRRLAFPSATEWKIRRKVAVPCNPQLGHHPFASTSWTHQDSGVTASDRILVASSRVLRTSPSVRAVTGATPAPRLVTNLNRPVKGQLTSPRRTCVMPISWSSTTDAKW